VALDGTLLRAEHARLVSARNAVVLAGTLRRTSLARRWLSRWVRMTKRKRRRRAALASVFHGPLEPLHSVKPETV